VLVGNGIKQSDAEKFLVKLGPYLVSGEYVVLICKCNNLKPMLDRVVLTDHRLLAVSSDGRIRFESAREELEDLVVEARWSGPLLTVRKSTGEEIALKSVDPEDIVTLRQLLESPDDPTATGVDLRKPVEEPAEGSAPDHQVVEQLRQLARLHDEGVLSKSEFSSAKARLLARL
jgi:hypothetical protein